MPGLPNRARAALSATTQNPAVSVFDSRQDSTRRVAQSIIATRYKKPVRHRYVGHVSCPHPRLRGGRLWFGWSIVLPAQKVWVNLVLGMPLAGVALGPDCHSPSFLISRRTRRRPIEIPSRNSAT